MSTAGFLYDGHGQPIGDAPPFEGPGSILPTLAAIRVIVLDLDNWDCTVELICTLPISPEALGRIVTTMDSGGAVAFHAESPDEIDGALADIMLLVGGAHA